eukprot:jgi/Chrzof1/7091/Cz02g10150.t1
MRQWCQYLLACLVITLAALVLVPVRESYADAVRLASSVGPPVATCALIDQHLGGDKSAYKLYTNNALRATSVEDRCYMPLDDHAFARGKATCSKADPLFASPAIKTVQEKVTVEPGQDAVPSKKCMLTFAGNSTTPADFRKFAGAYDRFTGCVGTSQE